MKTCPTELIEGDEACSETWSDVLTVFLSSGFGGSMRSIRWSQLLLPSQGLLRKHPRKMISVSYTSDLAETVAFGSE